MGKEGRLPTGRPVATIAVDGGGQVVGRFERGYDSSAGRVALHTLRGCPAKDTLKVTALTLNLRMAAGEREASDIVINFDVRAVTSLGPDLVWLQNPRTEHERT
jgi:hypothetical protein